MSISNLQEKRNKLIIDAAAILQAAEVTVENRASADAMLAEVTVIDGDIHRLRNIEKLQAEAKQFERAPRAAVNPGTEDRKKSFNEAFRMYARHGYAALNAEQRDLVTTSDTTGGALIPQEFGGILHEAQKFYGPIASMVQQKVTDNNGRPLKISFANDTSNGVKLLGTEGSSSPTETDPGFVSAILGVDTVTGGLVKVSFQELEDSAFNLDSWLRNAFSIRYARGIEKAVTLGLDQAGTALPNFSTGGLVAAATVGTTTGTIAAGIGWDDLVNAFSALDPAYVNQDTKWVMSSQTRNYLVGLKDGFGRPFFTPDPSNNAPFSKLMGYDIVLDQAMPATGVANALPILFGDLSKAYMLRTDGQPSILRLNERYADTLEVGFFLYTRIGGISLNAGIAPVVSLKIAAS